MVYVRNFTALTTGETRWNTGTSPGTATVVSYSFLEPDELPGFNESPPAAGARWENTYVTLTAEQRAAVRAAAREYEANSGLRFVEVPDPAQASLRFLGNEAAHLTSWAYLPDTPVINGNVSAESIFVTLTYSQSQNWSMDVSRGGELFTIILHEMGHSIGLEHPFSGILLDPALDNHQNTIMSYDWYWDGYASGRARDTLGWLDIDAIRFLYGAPAGYGASWQESGQYVQIAGTGADDHIVGARAASLLQGGLGDDRLFGMQSDDTLRGALGSDWLEGGGGNDRLEGWEGHDTLIGGGGADLLSGGAGRDVAYGQTGNDTLGGGPGDDWLSGGAGNDRLEGWGENDTMLGGDGVDHLYGGTGNDSLSGEQGTDLIVGAFGDDVLQGGFGSDRIQGGDGRDRLFGGTGPDLLAGGAGDDTLRGDGDNDSLTGDAGNDRLWGGAGSDLFIFNGAAGTDRIEDWQDGIDRISLAAEPGFSSFADVAAVAVQRNGDVVISLAADETLVLANTQLASLDARDFVF